MPLRPGTGEDHPSELLETSRETPIDRLSCWHGPGGQQKALFSRMLSGAAAAAELLFSFLSLPRTKISSLT